MRLLKPSKQMGFHLLGSAPASVTTPAVAPLNSDDLFRFDSGRTLSFGEGTFNALCAGATGRGKSKSFVEPALNRLIGAGFGGVVIDVKGNVTDAARRMAAAHGRAQDVLELGTARTATPINLFNGLSIPDLQKLVRAMSVSEFEHSTGNLDWALKGVKVAHDIIQLLTFLGKREPAFKPNVVLVNAMLHNFRLSRGVMEYFNRKYFDADKYEHALFVDELQDMTFHPLVQKPQKGTKAQGDWDAQTTWNLQAVRHAFSLLAGDPKIRRNFASTLSPKIKLDFGQLVYKQKKIVILRFDPQTTAGGVKIAKFVKEKFYQDAYAHGLLMAPGGFTFCVMDEFQDIIDLDPNNSYNDSAWFAKSREFRNINVIATQAFASLYAVSARPASVDSLLNNCSTKVIMQMDDPRTNDYLASLPSVPLMPSELQKGRCLLMKYDLSTRNYIVEEDGVQQAHDQGQVLLESMEGLDEAPAPVPVKGQKGKPVPVSPHPSGLPVKLVARILKLDPDKNSSSARIVPKEAKGVDEEQFAATLQAASPRLLELYKGHKELFDPQMGAESLAVPAGWIGVAEWFLVQVAKLGVPVAISGMGGDQNGLAVSIREYHSPAKVLASEASELSRKVCMCCGRRIIRRKLVVPAKLEGEEDGHYSYRLMRLERKASTTSLFCRTCRDQDMAVVTGRVMRFRGVGGNEQARGG